MKVNIISPEFPPDIGGVETYAFEFSKELAHRGHEVRVFTYPHPQGEIEPPGVKVFPLLRLRRVDDRKLIRSFSADVWHAMTASYAWIALENVPTVVSVHGNDFLRPYILTAKPNLCSFPVLWRFANRETTWLDRIWLWRTNALISKSLPRANHIVTNSAYTERVLLSRIPICRGRTSVGYVGVSERCFSVSRHAAPDGIPRLLTVCRLSEPRKNVDQVIRALSMLKDNYVFRYIVVGDGKYKAELEALSFSLGLEDRIIFTGFISDQELLDAYSKSDLFVLTSSVLPYSHEGFGIVYLEAAAAGIPSLAARVGGAAEAVSEGETGILIDNPTVDEIAQALRAFFEKKITFKSEVCQKFARRFIWKKVVDHVVMFYPHLSCAEIT